MEALAAIQEGMSTMQQSITSMQQEVCSINKRTEQTSLISWNASSVVSILASF
jgi:hypothetical protein